MEQPVVPRQVIVQRNAKLHFAAIMQQLYYQVILIELEPSPHLTD